MNTVQYLYNCYCGPISLREDNKQGHSGSIYSNCPRINAPEIKASKISEIKHPYMIKFLSKIDQYIDAMIDFGATRADLMGSFVRGNFSTYSDIDIEIFCSPKKDKHLSELESKLKEIDGLEFDLTPHSHTLLMPHMTINKGDHIILFDLTIDYMYSEDSFLYI